MKLYNISINNLLRRKAKLMFVLIGLIIGISTIVSVYGVVEAMKLEMSRQVSEFGVNVVITPDAGGLAFSYGGITLPEIMYDVEQLTNKDVDTVATISSREMLKIISPKLLGLAKLENHQKALVVGANLQEEFTIKPWLRLKEIDEAEADNDNEASAEEGDEKMPFQAINLSRQDLELLTLEDNQIIVGFMSAASLSLAEGSVLQLEGQEFEVYGVLDESGNSEDNQIFMNLKTAQELLNKPDEITVIEMAVDYSLSSEEKLLAELETALPHTKITSMRQEALRRDEMLTRLVRFGMTISILVLLIGMLVVGLTMFSSVRERTREIGVFRALGFRKTDIAKLILLEGLLISIAGGIIGYLFGMLLAHYSGEFIAGAEIVVQWKLSTLIMAVGLSVFMGLISSLYPAYRAANQDPVEALRFF